MRFLGDYSGKTDAKGRVFLPAAFRKQMEAAGEERLILRSDLFQPCLVLYPQSLWDELLDALRARLSRLNAEHQAVLRRWVADAEPVELDGNGRLLLNKRKLAYAGIRSEVRFLAVDDHVEIWDREACETHLSGGDDLGSVLQGLDLGL